MRYDTGIHPGWDASPMCVHIHTLIDIQGQLNVAIPPTAMFLGSGRKPENLQEIHTGRENMQNSGQTVTQAQNRTRNLGAVKRQCYLLHTVPLIGVIVNILK